MSERPLLDSLAVPLSVAGCVASVFMVYRVAIHERAPAAASFSSLCLLALVFIIARAKTLSRGELTVAGVAILMIMALGTFAAVHGVY